MSAGRDITTLYFTVFCGMITIALIFFAPWLLWIPLIAIIGLGATRLNAARTGRHRHVGDPLTDFAGADASNHWAPPKETRLTDVLLPTSRPDYSFRFSASVTWSPLGFGENGDVNHAALATDAILKRAIRVTETRDPAHASLVQHELASALGEMQADATTRVRAMADSVRIVLPAADQERLDKLATSRKEEALWEHERMYERIRREYLGGDVLKDPGSAVVWWLARNNEHVEKTVQDIGLLAQLSSAANNADLPPTFHPFLPGPAAHNGSHMPPHTVPDEEMTPSPEEDVSAADGFEALLRKMQFDEADPQRRLFVRQLADLAAQHHRQEIAEELIRRYDPPGEAEEEEPDFGS